LAYSALLAAALLAPRSAHALQLEAGDLLVTDYAGDRVLLVDPVTHAALVFSPRAGSGPNLLDGPGGIAIDPDGEILVVSSLSAKLISIDPATGAQTEVRRRNLINFPPTEGPLDIGDLPWGIDVVTAAPSLTDRRDVYIGSEGAIYRVTRSESLTTASPLITNSSLVNQIDLAIGDETGAAPVLFVTSDEGLIRYDDPPGAFTVVVPGAGMRSADYLSAGPHLDYVQRDSCPGGAAYRSYGGSSFSPFDATLIPCPWGIGIGKGPVSAFDGVIYVTDWGGVATPPRVVRFLIPAYEAPSVAADLPPGSQPIDVAVSPVTFAPEPEALALAAGALAALVVWTRRRAPPIDRG
jgi:hypothetical protein